MQSMRDVKRFPVVKLDEKHQKDIEDEVVVEEPLEVRVNGESISVIMRTPGNDFDLTTGLLLTEGIIHSCDEIGTIAYCPDETDPELKNVVNVGLLDAKRKLKSSRWSWSSSSCGLCGKATLDAIHQECKPITSAVTASYDVVCSLPLRLRQAQSNFDRTGGIHAAGLFDLKGRLLMLREDIGRHNAVDKMLGASLTAKLPMDKTIMMVSGRLGFEIAQKALVAGIPIVASVSAPSSLALDLAGDFQMTAIGFLRGGSMNIYTHPERVSAG
jgi:FdhD protein